MRRWVVRGSVSFLLGLLIAAALYECSTHVVRGCLRGEAFYDGRPTSYWRTELQYWNAADADHFRSPALFDEHVVRPKTFIFTKNRTSFQKWCNRWMPNALSDENSIAAMMAEFKGPSLFHGDEAAEPVLRELLADSSEAIRRFARIGLRMEPEFPVIAK